MFLSLCRALRDSASRYSSSVFRQHLRSLSTAEIEEAGEEGTPSYEESFRDYHESLSARRRILAKKNKPLSNFVDHLIIECFAGQGGDGCVAFHREKFKPRGPPSGGNGGPGGCCYVKPVAGLNSLNAVYKKYRARDGENGKGSWLHGSRGADTVIEVPVGTVIKQLPLRSVQEEEDEASSDRFHYRSPAQREEEIKQRRESMFIHYPSASGEHQAESDHFLKIETILLQNKKRQAAKRKRDMNQDGFEFDLTIPDMPAILVAKGGIGGTGNPAFASSEIRSPKFATRGQEGERVRLSLELKTIADVGLVGFPNRGKSTLLRSLTNAQATVASYAFTTLSPQVGTAILYSDGSSNATDSSTTIEDSPIAPLEHSSETMIKTERKITQDRDEAFRFTIADCPGLLPDASQNVGLGHSFLRHIERARLLLYVVDLSLPNPELELEVLKKELEAYQPELSRRARLVVANKADLVQGGQEVAEARIARLETWLKENEVQNGEVVVISAKHRGNLTKLLGLLRDRLVTEAEDQRQQEEEQKGKA